MLRIIHASPMGGSGCLLNDLSQSSLDDSTCDGDAESEFDCSVRYLCELDTQSASSAFGEDANCEVRIHDRSSKTKMIGKDEDELADSLGVANGSGKYGESLETQPPTEDQLTIDEAIDKIGFGKFQVKLMLIIGLCWMADGSEMMLLSILGPTLKCFWHLSDSQEALLSTTVFFGVMIGCAFWGWSNDLYGRKKILILSTLALLYFGVLSSQAPSYNWIIVIRMFVGICIGGVPQGVTLVAELLPSSSRGRCIILLELFWAAGSMFAVILALIVVNSIGWRWYLVLAAFPVLFALLLFKWIPESPRYLVTAGRKDEAIAVLRQIARENGQPMPKGNIVGTEMNTSRGKLSDLFSKEFRLSTSLLWIIWFTCAFTYYGVVLLSTEMFQTQINSCTPKGIHARSQACGCFLLSTKDYTDFLWTTCSEFPGILLTLPLIEYLGRKKTLAFEFLAAAFFFLLLLICSSRTWNIVFLFGARGCITGAFQVAYVYTPELFPTNVRALGLGSSSAISRIGSMTTPFVAQVLLKTSFYSVIGVYVSFLLLCCLACLLLPIETKGRALEDTSSLSVSYSKKTGYDRLR